MHSSYPNTIAHVEICPMSASSLRSARMASVQDTAALMACFASSASFFLGYPNPFRADWAEPMQSTTQQVWDIDPVDITTWNSKVNARQKLDVFFFPFSDLSLRFCPMSCPFWAHVIQSMQVKRHVLPFYLQGSHLATGELSDKNSREETERCTTQPKATP